jgi:hypothetical protein
VPYWAINAATCCVVKRVISRRISQGMPMPVPRLIRTLPVVTWFMRMIMPPAMTVSPPARAMAISITATVFMIWRTWGSWMKFGRWFMTSW